MTLGTGWPWPWDAMVSHLLFCQLLQLCSQVQEAFLGQILMQLERHTESHKNEEWGSWRWGIAHPWRTEGSQILPGRKASSCPRCYRGTMGAYSGASTVVKKP